MSAPGGAGVRIPITGLYVPGDRPDRFDKAVASGADLVILDLEDAVAPDQKPAARTAVAEWLRARSEAELRDGPTLQVRLNSPADDDLEALVGIDDRVEFRVPKVEHSDDLAAIVAHSPGRPLTALLETALGVEQALLIARHPGVTRLGIGESDLASELGSRSEAVLGYARARVLFASLAAGLPAPMMSAYPGIRDLDGLRTSTEEGRANGWSGRVAIHPAQLDTIRAACASTADEVAWATEVLAVTAGGGVATLANGDMVDPAMVGRAERIQARAPLPDPAD